MKETYRFIFEKRGRLCFVSHLDTHKAVQKALMRSGLPAAFSQGFNPHPLLSFAVPLTTGMEGLAEIMEIGFDGIMPPDDDLPNVLNAHMPEGFSVLRARKLLTGEKAAGALVRSADYEVLLPSAMELTGAVTALLGRAEIVITTRAGRELDARPLIYSLEAEGRMVRLRCAAGNISLKPEAVLELLCGDGFNRYAARITRKRLILDE